MTGVTSGQLLLLLLLYFIEHKVKRGGVGTEAPDDQLLLSIKCVSAAAFWLSRQKINGLDEYCGKVH